MLNEKFLERWIPILVPEEYGPDKSLEAGKPLLGIYIIPADRMEKIKNFWYKGTPEEHRLFGQLVDIGEVLALAGKEKNNLKRRFVMRLNQSQSECAGIFSLAHEVGHLHGILTNSVRHEEEPDDYADAYAFEAVKSKVEDQILRTKIYIEALNNDLTRV
jgi:hypothetical protein